MNTRLPLLISVTILLLQITAVTVISVQNSGGSFIYVLDDSYIHLAIAKNISQNGVWGTTSEEFSASSSSLVWTTILAIIFSVSGVWEMVPFLLNILISILVLYELSKFLSRFITSEFLLTIALIGIPIVSLFPFLVLSGMEHLLHIYLCLLMMSTLLNYFNNKKSYTRLIILSFLLSSVRYEAIFFIMIILLLILWRKDVKTASVIGIAALLPVVLFGLYSLSQGGYFFPNTILLKGQQSGFSIDKTFVFLFKPLGALIKHYQHLLFIFIILLIMIIRQDIRIRINEKLAIVILVTGFFHLIFARVPGTFDFSAMIRYDAYLVFIGTTLISGVYGDKVWLRLKQILKSEDNTHLVTKAAYIFIIVILCFPFLFRAAKAIVNTLKASENIHSQQIQMSRFFSSYYSKDNIAVNDIGAVSYVKGEGVIDLAGLSDTEIASARLNGNFTSTFINEYLRKKKVEVLAVYDIWFADISGFENELFRAGEWIMRDNVICGDSIVSFYALNHESAERLKKNLRTFEALLPAHVKTQYY